MSRRMERKYMSDHKPDIEAIRKFRTPAYEVARMIRAQGEQIEKKNK